MHPILDQIKRGLKGPSLKIVVVAVDLSKALQIISHSTLLNAILRTGMPDFTKMRLTNSLEEENICVQFKNTR